MTDEALPREVTGFIADHIGSVVELEVLLLLHAQPARQWSAADIGRELRIDPAWVSAHLKEMSARGLLSRSDEPEPIYAYRPGTAELDAAVNGLASAYADRRVTVITLIFSKPPDKIRSFADAFRLRKERTDG